LHDPKLSTDLPLVAAADEAASRALAALGAGRIAIESNFSRAPRSAKRAGEG
jgi:hypothetical protein